MPAPAFVVVGRVRKAHGIRGELVVESITDEPDAHFAVGKRLRAGDASGHLADPDAPGPSELTIRRAVPFKGGWIVRTGEITDRTAADAWRGRYLLVPAAELTPPGENEVYYHDLVGLRVERGDGALLGEVEGLYEVPQGLMLDVRTPRGLVMLPYRPEVIERVDVGRRTLVANPPVGLFED